jgi:hypothetical protein
MSAKYKNSRIVLIPMHHLLVVLVGILRGDVQMILAKEPLSIGHHN